MYRRTGVFWLVSSVLVAVVFILVGSCADSGDVPDFQSDELAASDTIPESQPVFDVRSVTLDARRKPDSTLLVRLRDLGVTHLTLVSFGWQQAIDDPRIRVDTTGWYTESHRGIRTLARQAEALGMGIILKPHLWVRDHEDGHDRSEIGFESEAGWQRWEADYRRFLMHYARLASDVAADVLVLGTELTRSTSSRPTFWRELAAEVRSVYDGRLTYAANWHEEYQTIAFWDELDYVGVQAYFPLTKADNPSLQALRTGWQTHLEALDQVHRRTNRPILFTEIGYRSDASAAAAPWEWPDAHRSGESAAPADSVLQARCFRAFLSTVGRAPWFSGAIIWKWHRDAAERPPTAFTPQGKPAERVIRRWFRGTSTAARMTRSPR